MEYGLQQMSRLSRATVGNTVKETLCPVPASVQSDGEPQIAGATEGKTEEKTYSGGPSAPTQVSPTLLRWV